MVNEDDQAARDAAKLLPEVTERPWRFDDAGTYINGYREKHLPAVAAALRERDERIAVLTRRVERWAHAAHGGCYSDENGKLLCDAASPGDYARAVHGRDQYRERIAALEADLVAAQEDIAVLKSVLRGEEEKQKRTNKQLRAWEERSIEAHHDLLRAATERDEARRALEAQAKVASGMEAENERLEDQLRRTQGYEAHIVAENARLREALKQEHELLWHDVIAYGSGRDAKPVRYAIVNDTFAYATADSEEISDGDLSVVYDAWQCWGHHGVTAWAALRRGAEPLEPLRTEQYREARAALAEVKR